MYESTQTNYQGFRLRVRSTFINRLSVFVATAFFLAAPGAFAQGAGPFPGSAVDSRTMRTQERVEELFEQGEYERAHLIYRDDLAPIGDKYAQYMLGYMYLTGTGVDEDAVLASAWYRLAAERSYKEFLDERDQLLNAFTAIDLIRSDELYLQLRRQYSDVVLLLHLIEADLNSVQAITGSRLSGSGSPVTIVDTRSGTSVSGAQFFSQVRRRTTARLAFMAKQLDRPDLNSNPDHVNLEELKRIVRDFTDTITDR